jgi:branched-chain amino acid transport system permease protein
MKRLIDPQYSALSENPLTLRSPAMSYDALTRSQKTAGLQGRGMLDFVQQLVSGIALGCVYGLIALGFVLIYKATEVVNFAQGDLMMLGGFFAFTFIGLLGLELLAGLPAAVCAMAAVRHGDGADRDPADPRLSAILHRHGDDRPRILPALGRRHDLGHRRPQDRDAVLHRRAAARRPGACARQALRDRGHRHPVRGAVLPSSTKTRIGTAMRATSENMLAAYYMGIPVKRVVSLIWAISAAVATCAGVLLAPITFVHSNVGLVLGLKAFPAAVLGGFGSIPGAVIGGLIIGVIESWPASTCRRDGRTSRPTSCCCGAAAEAGGLFGPQHAQEGLRAPCGSSSRQTTTRTSAAAAQRLLVVLRRAAGGCVIAFPYLSAATCRARSSSSSSTPRRRRR